jgi:Phage integrase family
MSAPLSSGVASLVGLGAAGHDRLLGVIGQEALAYNLATDPVNLLLQQRLNGHAAFWRLAGQAGAGLLMHAPLRQNDVAAANVPEHPRVRMCWDCYLGGAKGSGYYCPRDRDDPRRLSPLHLLVSARRQGRLEAIVHGKHVDFVHGWLRLDPNETKNDEGRMYPLTRSCAVLEAQRARTKALERASGRIIPWVFHRDGVPIRSFTKSWHTAARRAGQPGRIPHDFRRTAVRNLERAGVPRSTAMKMAGHKTEAMYRRYAIVDEAMLKEGAEKIARLQQLPASSVPNSVPSPLSAPSPAP